MWRRRSFLCRLGAALLLPAPALAAGRPERVDRILVVKRERRMDLFAGGRVVRSFRVALGRNPYGPKQQAGDGRTPEGRYVIDGRLSESLFYKALSISYPNAEDRARARRLGVDPGHHIVIHGLDPNIPPALRPIHWMFNWTDGCLAVTDREMDELWQMVRIGTPIEIRP